MCNANEAGRWVAAALGLIMILTVCQPAPIPLPVDTFLPVGGFISGWNTPDAVRTYNQENLYNLVDGQFDAFFAYGFEQVSVQHYQNATGARLNVEIWQLANSADAYGLSHCGIAGQPAAIGVEGDSDPGRRLAFWQQRYFVSVTATEAIPDETLWTFAKEIAMRLPSGGEPPAIVKRLSAEGPLEWISFRQARANARKISPRLRLVKYLFLVIILIAALFGNMSLLIFEPLASFTRAMTEVVIPGLNYAINASEGVLYSLGLLRPLVDGLENVLRGTILPVKQPVFNSPWSVALLFFGIIALNLLADRFWCRYLCPLGGLLGWLAKISIFQPFIGSACNGCTRCAIACKPGAIQTVPKTAVTRGAADITIVPSECTVCLDCLASCAKEGMSIRPVIRSTVSQQSAGQEFNLSRRQFLLAFAGGAAGVVLLRTDIRLRAQHSFLLRPPAVTDEAEFLSKCVRCTECLKICPTTGLQPSPNEAGLEGLWTPLLMPRVGYCDYGCNACGQVCPSEAIPKLSLEEKRQQIVGNASVNRDRCLPWASNIPCIVCEEMCPTPEKAIRLEKVNVVNQTGETIELQQPYVWREVCISCGICENHCPLEGEAGIRVYSV